jgi:predicted ArsR family transcriptional regulator
MAYSRTRQKSSKNTQKSAYLQQKIPTPSFTPDVKGSIRKILHKEGALTRGQITKLTGIPRTTVYDTLMNLLLSGIIEKYVERNGQRGRPQVYYQLID